MTDPKEKAPGLQLSLLARELRRRVWLQPDSRRVSSVALDGPTLPACVPQPQASSQCVQRGSASVSVEELLQVCRHHRQAAANAHHV